MSHTNPTSSIRGGFDYQNLWSLKLCGEWLVNPAQYKSIQFETCPDDDNPNKFYLDDIVCLDSDDRYHFYQVKHRQDSANEWTWDNLLTTKKKSSGTSIMNKWARSLLPRLEKTKDAFFITNSGPAEEIKKFLNGETLDIQKLKKEDKALYARLIAEIGKEEDLVSVFQKLHFQFNREDLFGDELENTIRKYFYEELSATESGASRLYLEIAKEARQSKPRLLDIETLRKWCEFDVPRPLEEQFVIPPDFEFFNDTTHQSILSDLQKPEGGIKVVFGKPGVGKSVYLSKLDKELREKEIICIKHHYHISPEDSNPLDRLNAERVVEAIKAQLKSHKEELGGLANKNSKDIPIREFIAVMSKKLSEEGRAMVVIIDGLDHVLRYADKEELESFLKEVCFPQPGVWIVIGMQEIAELHLPQVVFNKCPKAEWIEIKGLNESAVTHLLGVNSAGLHLPDHMEQFKGLAKKLFSITGGNPLHLRYSLQQLKNLSGTSLVTDYSCDDLLPYGDSIEKYYESLWRQISDNAKMVLLTITSVNFLFTEKQLIECVSFAVQNPADITKGFNEISHLVSKKHRDQLSVYHNSFEVFLRSREEMKQQKIAIKMNVRKWLQQSNYEYLKWAELRIIEHELGDSGPILSIDRQWLIDSIAYPCNPDQISNQMKLAARVACEKGDLAKGLQISYLHAYYLNSKQFVDEATELIWREALNQHPNFLDHIDFASLPVTLLPEAAELADSRGDSVAVEGIIEMLIGESSGQEYRKDTVPPISRALLETVPYNRKHEVERIYKYVIQFRDLDIAPALFQAYCRKLLALGQKENIRRLLQLELARSEKRAILEECAKYGLNNQEDVSEYLTGQKDLPNLCLVYESLRNEKVKLPKCPFENETFPSKIPEYASEERDKYQKLYHDNFIVSLLYGLANKQEEVEKWITSLPDSWAAKAMACVLTASLRIASEIQQSKISHPSFFESFEGLEILKWPDDRDSLSFQNALSQAMNEILRDVISIKSYIGDGSKLDENDYIAMTGRPSLFSRDDLTALVLGINKPLLSTALYEKIRDEILGELDNTITNFPDRAKVYANVSRLARLYNDRNTYESSLTKAVDNLLGYGYHKDTYLFDLLDAIGYCGKAGTSRGKIDEWVARVIPLIHSVGEYTDGDETHSLPYELAELLAKEDPQLLRKCYYWSADQEKFYPTEELFQCLLNSFSFASEEEITVAGTALDKDSFAQLTKLAEDSSGAASALNDIKSYLGEINYPKEAVSHYPDPGKSVPDYSTVNPDALLKHITDGFENRWEWNTYLEGWLCYWVGQMDKRNILQTFSQIVEKFGMKAVSAETLDIVYPAIYEIDSEEAFNILCKAQVEGYGWQQHFTDKKKAERRWKFIKAKYPQRYLEFFERTTERYVPLGRGVDFFLLVGDLERAEAITEAGLQFAESLMADLRLPSAEWLEEKKVTVLDILIQRLAWPSPLVRERVATGLAKLLCTSGRKIDIFKKLLSWIQQQKMESMVAIALLPIIKAFHLAGKKQDLEYITIDDIRNATQVNSEVVERLFDEISNLIGVVKPELPIFKKIEPVPSGYSRSIFFSKYFQTFLAPIYMVRAEKIEKQSRKQFIDQWAFTFDGIVQDAGIVLNGDQVYYYARGEHDEFLSGFSSKISEAFRSAFLRVLRYYYENGDIKKDFFLEYSYATLPIELSRWKILPCRSPEWWPKLAQCEPVDAEKQNSIVPIVFKKPIEEIIENSAGNLLIAAEGAIQPAEGWTRTDPLHSFSLIAFGYKTLGPDLPLAEEIHNKVFHSTRLVTIPSMTERPFSFLEDKGNHLPVSEDPFQIEGILIYPIVARERDLVIPLWQNFRFHYSPFNLNLVLTQRMKIVLCGNSWKLQDEDGQSIAEYTDWLEGLRERYHRDVPHPHGQFLVADKDFLNKLLKANGLRLGYVLKTTYRSRQYSHEELKEYEDTKLINVSSIIV